MGKTTPFTVAGAMTGTSCDGMDIVVARISNQDIFTIVTDSVDYPKKLRHRVLSFQNPGSKHSSLEWLELDRDLGLWYATVFRKFSKKYKLDLIANHGQTLAHFPNGNPIGTTLQLGDPFIIANETGITTTAQFRKGDMAGGGQGAPLATIFHQKLIEKFFRSQKGVSIHNIGGVSNFSYFLKGECKLSFDTGPGNSLIDIATEIHTHGSMTYDKDGILGRKGTIDPTAVSKLLKHPFIKKLPPKSTGRDEFHEKLLKELSHSRGVDLIATATALTVESIADAYERFVIKKGYPLTEVLITGGGAKNPFLVSSLKKRMKTIRWILHESFGIDSQSIESLAFAYMGYLTVLGKAVGGAWTGAEPKSPPGLIIPGHNWKSLLRKLNTHT